MIFPENHGKTWTEEDIKYLKYAIKYGQSIKLAAESLQRNESAVCIKAASLGLGIYRDGKFVSAAEPKKSDDIADALSYANNPYNVKDRYQKAMDENYPSYIVQLKAEGLKAEGLKAEELKKKILEKEKEMESADNSIFEVRVLVGGRNVSKMTEGECIHSLQTLECHEETLSYVANDSPYYEARMVEIEEARQAVHDRLEEFVS